MTRRALASAGGGPAQVATEGGARSDAVTNGVQPTPGVVVVGESEQSLLAALPFARRAAEHLETRVAVRLADPSSHELGIGIEVPDWLEQLRDETVASATAVAVRDIPEAIEQYVQAHSALLAIAAAGSADVTTPYYRNLVAAPPCPILLLLHAGKDFSPRRILMATNTFAPLSEEATHLSYDLANAGPEVHVTFLRLVGPHEPDEVLSHVSAELELRIRDMAPFGFEVLVQRARSYESGILDVLEDREFDLVITDSPRSGLFGRLAERVLPERLVAGPVPLLLYSAPSGRAARAVLRTWNLVYRVVPSTDAEARVGIYSSIRRRSRADPDYYVMLSLSVIIAALGLLLDSAAVVIGAMIIAPLMRPIVGIGLGISMGNGRLVSIGLGSAARGVVLSVVIAAIVGALVPGADITGQLDARGQPQLLDLSIALASGAAGAYASCRKGVGDTVAGVAIAVALVPPLATAGVGLALTEWPLATGAGLLFATNFVAIGASSALMFLWMGFKPEAGRFGTRRPFTQGIATLAGLVAVVAFSLVLWARAGDARFDRQVSTAVDNAVRGIEPEAEVAALEVGDRDAGVLRIEAEVRTVDVALVLGNELAIQSEVSRALDRAVSLEIDAHEPEAPEP